MSNEVMNHPYILVVDDEPDIRGLVQEILEDENYVVQVAENGEMARRARRDRRPDLVLLDIWMPDVDGITLLKEWSEDGTLPFPVIVMSGHGTVETAVEATRLGAYDFIEKPLSLAKLLLTVERALEADNLRRENIGLRRQSYNVIEPVGRSDAMNQLREQARRIAQHDTWILISGEAGSGKETFARYLHKNSARSSGAFVSVGVAAIARENSELELFGSEQNGNVRYGMLEQANGGVLYLDDIADMDIQTQGRLTSALASGSFLRLGGREQVNVNMRVIAATRRDIEKEVQAGNFREDLYYQLNVVPLNIPPLRDHHEDVLDLLNYYVDMFVAHEKLPYRHFSVAAQNRLMNYNWPGNIKELKNLVQRLLILSDADEISLAEVDASLSQTAGSEAEGIPSSLFDMKFREAREQFERDYLLHQFHSCGGSVGKLSAQVGMERTNLYRKLRALGIDVKQAAK